MYNYWLFQKTTVIKKLSIRFLTSFGMTRRSVRNFLLSLSGDNKKFFVHFFKKVGRIVKGVIFNLIVNIL